MTWGKGLVFRVKAVVRDNLGNGMLGIRIFAFMLGDGKAEIIGWVTRWSWRD